MIISPSDKAEKKSVRSGRNRAVHGGCVYENAMNVFRRENSSFITKTHQLGSGFEYVLFSLLFGEDSNVDYVFQGVETTN